MVESSLAALRRELLELVDLVDTAEPPAPDRRDASARRMAWDPAKDWTVQVFDDPDEADGCIFVSTPQGFGPDGDLLAIKTQDARRLAAVLVAACQRVERQQ